MRSPFKLVRARDLAERGAWNQQPLPGVRASLRASTPSVRSFTRKTLLTFEHQTSDWDQSDTSAIALWLEQAQSLTCGISQWSC